MVKKDVTAGERTSTRNNAENKYFPFNQIWLRLDVDYAVALKNKRLSALLNLYRIKTGLPVLLFLKHIEETRKFLSKYPDIPRIWFFRWYSCPKKFEEAFGLHATSPEKFDMEYNIIKSKLGEFKYFTRHGFSKHASGKRWTVEQIRFVERKYHLRDLSDLPHLTIGSTASLNSDLSSFNHILFHPYLIWSHKKEFEKILSKVQNFKLTI